MGDRVIAGRKMIAAGKEYICTWPNGESKKVMVTSFSLSSDGGDNTARVIWNYPINGRVTGADDTVPVSWLQKTEDKVKLITNWRGKIMEVPTDVVWFMSEIGSETETEDPEDGSN